MTALDIFRYDGADVRTLTVDGEVWFVLADLCRVLGLSNPSMVLSRLHDSLGAHALSQAEVTDALGRTQFASIVNESAMYEVVIRSDKPEAISFRRWITTEVLPAIRKTGAYVVPTSDLDQIRALHAAVGTLLEQNEKAVARAVVAETFKSAIEHAEGLTPREFHKHYLSDMPERAFFEVLYASNLLIDQRGQRYGADGRSKPGKQHGHPSFTGKAFFYLHATLTRDGDRFENTRVRPGDPELELARWFAKRGHPVSASSLAVHA